MSKITRGGFHVYPFLAIGATRHCLFPEAGSDVEFTIENFAFVDGHGRETLTWTRRFFLVRERCFDEYLIYSEARKCLVLYAGTHQHIAVDLSVSVGEGGSLVFETGAQRLYEWKRGIPFPLLLSGKAHVCESYDESIGRFQVDVDIRNRLVGHIFGYTGSFDLQEVECPTVPERALPKRTELRE